MKRNSHIHSPSFNSVIAFPFPSINICVSSLKSNTLLTFPMTEPSDFTVTKNLLIMPPICVSNLEIPCGSGHWNGWICHKDRYYAFIFQNLAQTFLWRIKQRYYTTELFPNLVASSSINLTKPFNFPTTAATPLGVIARAERDGTRAETRFLLSPTRTSPFKSVGASVQSTAGSRSVRISLNNAG